MTDRGYATEKARDRVRWCGIIVAFHLSMLWIAFNKDSFPDFFRLWEGFWMLPFLAAVFLSYAVGRAVETIIFHDIPK